MLDRAVKVPLAILSGELRVEAAQRVFGADRRVPAGWEHRVLEPFGDGAESWAFLAGVFAGDRDAAQALRRRNPSVDRLTRGARVLVPESMLLEAFADVAPAPSVTAGRRAEVSGRGKGGQSMAPAAPATSAIGRVLTFAHDQRGEYATYRLRRGEALYSAVVVRFTGQLHAAEVNATALEIARRSGIADVTAIPVGYPVKIPLELLAPEYLPEGHPRRVRWRQEQQELAQFVEVVRAADLSGVHVILDAGHGGVDSGAEIDGIWESTYAYDVMCRIKLNLERHTRATVWTLIRDESRRYSIPDRDRLPSDRDQELLTEPRYDLASSTHGVHLRWYLVNRIVRERLDDGVPAAKIVLVSVHADSLHPSVRGAMAYIPSRTLRPERYRGRSRTILQRFAEYRAEPEPTFSREFRSRAEASSRRLAEHLIAALTGDELAVHPYKPIRDSVLRGRERWVPAVLKGSRVQTSVLLEICNLANDKDRELVIDRRWRERFARAAVRGIAAAFDGGAG
jgi:N-acetylmuramoyl-L-alanine amidase